MLLGIKEAGRSFTDLCFVTETEMGNVCWIESSVEEGQRLFSIFIKYLPAWCSTVTQHDFKRLWIAKLNK